MDYVAQADELSKRNIDSAILMLEKAIELDQNNAKAYQGLGSFYLQKQRYSDAIANYKTLLELKPEHAEAAQIIAMIYTNMDSTVLAEQYYVMAEERFLGRLKKVENEMQKNQALASLAMNYGIMGKPGKMQETIAQIENEQVRQIWMSGAENFSPDYVKQFFQQMEKAGADAQMKE